MSELKIITQFINPPIPIRGKDWRAYIDGDEETRRYGEGPTEYEAVSDLLEQYGDCYWPGGQKNV